MLRIEPAVVYASWGPIDDLKAWAGNAILWITGRVTWVGGQLLEVSTNKLVLGMGDILNGSFGSAINSIWKTIRDICNLAFIFGFIFTGIRTIIDPENAETKRFISKIIIAALLINFSLFFVKVIIDFSNFTAYQIYTNMTNGSGSLAQKVADTLGIVTIFSSGNPELLDKVTSTGAIGFYVMAGIFLIIAGFVFAAGAILLISRFVTLIYIMIASPVLFAGTIFPQTEEYASSLWHKLISAAFFAPAYFLLTIIALRILEALPLNKASTGNTFASALNSEGGAEFFDIILFFFVAIFFLMGALSIAHSMGIKGSEIVIKKTKSMIGASTAGLAAKAGRMTAGKLAYHIGHSDSLRDKASENTFKGFLARRTLGASHSVAHASFDGRNVGGVGKDLGLGDGQKGGYDGDLKKFKEKEQKYAKDLGHNEHHVEVVEGTYDAQIKTAKTELTELKKNANEATAPMREQLKEKTRLYNEAVNAGNTVEKEKLEKEMGALNVAIQNEKEIHATRIQEATDNITQLTEAKKEKVKQIKGSRQKNYAEVVESGVVPLPKKIRSNKYFIRANKYFNYGNAKAAHAIRDDAKKDKSDNEKLIDEIKGLKNSGGGGGGAPSAPAADPHH